MTKRLLTLFFCWALAIHAPAATITGGGSVFDPAAPGPIGGTTPSTGAFTTLSATSTTTLPAGVVGSPLVTFSNWGAWGIFARDGTTIGISNGSGSLWEVASGSMQLASGQYLGWSPSATLLSAVDTILLRDAANTLAQRNGTADQAFRVYGLYTDASNYHYGSVAMSDTALTISAVTAGTGVDNLDIVLTPSGTGAVKFSPDATFDLGAAGATRPRNGYFSGSLVAGAGGFFYWTGRSVLASPSDGQVVITNQAGSAGSAVVFGLRATNAAAPTIASAGTIAPTTPIVFVSGVTTIETITAPSPISVGGGSITIIPTGIFLTGVTGNIAIASTTVVGKALTMTFDVTTAKWYPSY